MDQLKRVPSFWIVTRNKMSFQDNAEEDTERLPRVTVASRARLCQFMKEEA